MIAAQPLGITKRQKIVTTYEVFDDMKIAAFRKAYAANGEDPTDPFDHSYTVVMLMDFGDVRNDASESVKRAVALEPIYLDILK